LSFQFRFASIVKLRQEQRDQAGAAVGQAHQAIHRIEEQLAAIELQRQALRDSSAVARVGSISVDSLLASGRYDLHLQADAEALQATRSMLAQELQRRQLALAAAEAEVKRFERLEEKDRSAHLARQARREQAEADEATACRHTIKRQR
jgi:flagellar FliJ protein